MLCILTREMLSVLKGQTRNCFVDVSRARLHGDQKNTLIYKSA